MATVVTVTATVTATVTVVVVAMQDMLLSVSDNDRYLADGNSDPVLIVGDAGWSAIAELTTAEMDTYLEDRAARGFNCVLVNLIEREYCSNAPNNIYNDDPFTSTEFTTPNEDYFTVADHFMDKALALGIYVLLDPIFLGVGGTAGWYPEIAAASTDDMQDWGEFIANRYGGYSNLIWAVGNDRDETDVAAIASKINAMITGIQVYDTSHLVLFMGNPNTLGTDYLDDLSNPSWMTLNNNYSYNSITSEIKDGYDYSPTKPCIYIEGIYENEQSSDVQDQRAQAYWSVLGGGCGHVFGNNPIWKFAYDGGDWEAALDDAGSVGMTRFSTLFNSIAWHTLVPDYAHGLVTSGYGTIGNADYLGAAIDASGGLAVIYMPSNRTMTVDMSLFSGTVTARWYDPTSGDYTADAASPLSNSGTHDFSRSATNDDGDADWVLLLEA